MQKLLYKYRGVQNFKYFVDIVLKKRLYASKYTDLNDPMEGQYYYASGQLNKAIRQKLKGEKGDLRICSLSRKKDNELMWSHYAEGHRGIAVGVLVDDAKYDLRPIQYTGLTYLRHEDINADSAIQILSHKLNIWDYEEEERVFIKDKFYIDIDIKQIVTGRAMSNQEYSFIKELLDKLDSDIELIKADTYM